MNTSLNTPVVEYGDGEAVDASDAFGGDERGDFQARGLSPRVTSRAELPPPAEITASTAAERNHTKGTCHLVNISV